MPSGYLLDTNVVSETRKKRPNQDVMAFLAKVEGRRLFISVLTVGELRKGVAVRRLQDTVAADLLSEWVDGIENTFADHILPIDVPIAKLWGELSGRRTVPVIDTLIAATGLVHGLTVVSRNTADLAGSGVPMLNPWNSADLNR